MACFILPTVLFAQHADERLISSAFEPSELTVDEPLPNQHIWANSFLVFDVNFQQLNTQLNGSDIPHRNDIQPSNHLIIELPNPDGSFDTYRVFKNTTMHPVLAAAYPEIRAYDVIGVSDRSKKGKIDITPQGFHAMIFDRSNGTFFIDPLAQGNTTNYMVYYKRDFVTSKIMSCFHDDEAQSAAADIIENENEIAISYASCALRTYRLAVAATGEYTTFHGGTVALALAAQVTSMNRVNGVYEKEIAITMTIIANNNLIVYTNASNDPYTNGTPGTMITQNQNNINSVIGSANYDIGHVFGTNSGGLAGLGVVCSNNNKARGVTGSAAPVGDPFDIDYVAHEIGHQFGGNHTQNNGCNSVNSARYEPGSASTIMGYAGICAPNVQNNSDDYFHTRSLQEMGNFISGSGHTCPVITTSGNTAPSISGTNGSVSLPISTPFALTATATDPDAGNTLYYRWEQYNNQASTQPPVSTSTGGPNFRSFVSTTNPTRYFPSLQAIANNGPFTWEVVPSVARTMNFRVTVHDDHLVGGCSDYVSTSVTFDATAGPFVLTYPSATGIIWTANTAETVTWNVANTNNANVDCQNVDIYLSTDGGMSYPIILATNVPNNGSASVTVPNLPNTTSRVMVMADNGTFFDISDNNFTIEAGNCVHPTLPVVSGNISVCVGDDVTLNVDSGVLNDAEDWYWYAGNCNSGTLLGTGTQITFPVAASMNVFVAGAGGCVIPLECLTIEIDASNADASFMHVGQALNANQTFAQHQWLDCSTNPATPILGATGPSFTMTNETGSYALQASVGGCVKTSPCMVIDMSSLESFGMNSVNIFPNPAAQILFVTWNSNELRMDEIKLFDASGKLVRTIPLGPDGVEIDIEFLSAGLYYLELRSDDQVQYFKVVKN
jgi:hypothetical protein